MHRSHRENKACVNLEQNSLGSLIICGIFRKWGSTHRAASTWLNLSTQQQEPNQVQVREVEGLSFSHPLASSHHSILLLGDETNAFVSFCKFGDITF